MIKLKKTSLHKLSRREVQNLIPQRLTTANKSHGGKCLIIAGSEGMYGAAVLAAKSAARIGAGYVYLAVDAQKFNSLKNPDFLLQDIKNKINFTSFSSIGFGPGLGQSLKALVILKKLIKSTAKKVVVDADALNLMAQYQLFPLPPSWIVTPHEGELARLLNRSSAQIKKDRVGAAKEAHKVLNCTVVLKGFKTLIISNKKIDVCPVGNKSLAKAGTGDVLTGMISGLLSQNLNPRDAAVLAVYLHGAIADHWVEKKDYLSLMASDVVENIPEILFQLRQK